MLQNHRVKHSRSCNQLCESRHSLQTLRDTWMSGSPDIDNQVGRSLINRTEKGADQVSRTATNDHPQYQHPRPTFSQEHVVSEDISHHYHPSCACIDLHI